MRRFVRTGMLAALVGMGALVAPVVVPAVAPVAAADDCSVQPGGPEQGTPWPQTRLNFQQEAWRVSQGAGITVAVVDSGVDFHQAQMSQVRRVPGVNVEGAQPSADTRDCFGHGTAVAGIIAAPKVTGVAFVGVAPQAKILPIKWIQGQSDQQATPAGLARGIDAAVQRGAQVINVSGGVTVDTGGVVKQAVANAAAHNVVVVAAAGNDGNSANTHYFPADYSTQFDNVLAVSATDQNDQVTQFSQTGTFVSVAAPGQGIEVPVPNYGYKLGQGGTSFAAPFVSGTAALVRSAFPKLTAAQVCARIKATADPPPAAVPDPLFGYGVINPNLAVTAVRDDAAPPISTPKREPLPAPQYAAPPDRHLQHLAMAIGLSLLALTVLVGIAAAVVRRAGPGQRRARAS